MSQFANAMPVIMLQGTFSHEPPGTLDVFRLLGAKYPVYVADRIHQVAWDGQDFLPSAAAVFSIEEIEALTQRDRYVRVVFTCVPTVNKAVVAAAVGAKDAAMHAAEILDQYFCAAGAVNRLLRGHEIATIGLSHGTVNGCTTEHGVPMAGLDHEFTVGGLFEAQCDFFALGHIHMSQTWQQEGRYIGYAGSIGRLHYGEYGDKGLLLWDVDRSRSVPVTVEQLVLPARQYESIDFPGLPDMAKLQALADISAGHYVRIRWSVDQEHRQVVDVDSIKGMFAKAAELKLEPRVIPVTRSRAQGIAQAQTIESKLAHWGNAVDIDHAGLVALLPHLQSSSDPSAIAAARLQIVFDRCNGIGKSPLQIKPAMPDTTDFCESHLDVTVTKSSVIELKSSVAKPVPALQDLFDLD